MSQKSWNLPLSYRRNVRFEVSLPQSGRTAIRPIATYNANKLGVALNGEVGWGAVFFADSSWKNEATPPGGVVIAA